MAPRLRKQSPVHKPLAAVVIEPLAVKIPEAAAIVGISRSQFYKDYLGAGLVTPIPNGSTGVLIDVAQLREAYGKAGRGAYGACRRRVRVTPDGYRQQARQANEGILRCTTRERN